MLCRLPLFTLIITLCSLFTGGLCKRKRPPPYEPFHYKKVTVFRPKQITGLVKKGSIYGSSGPLNLIPDGGRYLVKLASDSLFYSPFFRNAFNDPSVDPSIPTDNAFWLEATMNDTNRVMDPDPQAWRKGIFRVSCPSIDKRSPKYTVLERSRRMVFAEYDKKRPIQHQWCVVHIPIAVASNTYLNSILSFELGAMYVRSFGDVSRMTHRIEEEEEEEEEDGSGGEE